GPAALLRLFPVLRGRRQAVLPAVRAQRRHIPGRALQHRQLCPAYPHGGAAVRPRGGRLHLDRRRLPSVQQPLRAGRTAAVPRAPSLSAPEHQAQAGQPVRVRIRRLRNRRLSVPSAHQGPCRRLTFTQGIAMAQPYIKLVVAYSTNRVIGRDNDLPWRLPGDLAHFKRSTMGQPIVMGRKTWESLGRPLPGRPNLVISRDPAYAAEGARTFTSLAQALAACEGEATACVIGGAQIFKEALPLADEISP